MDTRSKRLWIVTLANIAAAGLLILVIYNIMLAVAALANEILGWPFFVLLAIGLVLSVIGLRFAKGVASRTARLITSVLNSCVLTLDLLIIFGLAALYFGSTKERFLIPNDYKGDVYVVYGVPEGESLNKTPSGLTYRIPKDGVLWVRGPMMRDWTRTEYYYQPESGHLEHISNFWLSTIHPTPENLANDRDIGVFFPRTGRFTDSTGCSVEYRQFYVGTKAHLLTKYKQVDISEYLRDHPVVCAKPQ